MKIYNNLDLKKYNSYDLPSWAKTAYFPENLMDLEQLFIANELQNTRILGGGYNIILAKTEYIDENFVFFRENFSQFRVEGNYIIANSGIALKNLSEIALENNLSGLEVFYDIPGTLGGAIFMNAGAYGEDIYGIIDEVTILNREKKKFEVLPAKQIASSYRFSPFQNTSDIIVSAKIRLQHRNNKDIVDKMQDILVKRSRFPKQWPNAGSVFLRPKADLTVGEMVEKIGLKGRQIGGAQISEQHGGFIININDATAKDILLLIEFIKREVYKNYQVELELEQKII